MAKKVKFTLVKEQTDCISSIRTMLVISKCFGCNLFYVPKDRYSTEAVQIKAIDYIVALLYIGLYFVFTFPFFVDMVFLKTEILISSGNFVVIGLVRFIFFFIIIGNFSCYTMETLNRNKIWSLLTKLYDFDEEAKNLGIKVLNNNKTFLIFCLRLFLMQVTLTVICGVLLSIQFESYWLILEFYISYVMMDGCYTTTFCAYNHFIYALRIRFLYINDALRTLLNIRDRSIDPSDTTQHVPYAESDQLRTLKKIANLYEMLTDFLRLLSECYSVQISIIVAVVFQFSLVCCYMFYQLFKGGFTTNMLMVTYAYSMRTFYFYSQILFAMNHGTKLAFEAKYTSQILSKAMNLPLKKSVLNQLQHFLQQISHSFTTVSCGLFSVDWTLFNTMMAALVSYQVLFIQFDILLMETNNNYSV